MEGEISDKCFIRNNLIYGKWESWTERRENGQWEGNLIRQCHEHGIKKCWN